MPIVNDKYSAPTWANGTTPAINASELNAISTRLAAVDAATKTLTTASVSVLSSYWQGSGPYTYTYSNAAIKSTSLVELLPGYGITKAQLDMLNGAQIVLAASTDQTNGSIKLTALGTKPTGTIPVLFQIYS